MVQSIFHRQEKKNCHGELCHSPNQTFQTKLDGMEPFRGLPKTSWLLRQRGPPASVKQMRQKEHACSPLQPYGGKYVCYGCMHVHVCLMFWEDNKKIKQQSSVPWSQKVSRVGSSELSRSSLPVIIGCWVGLALTRMPAFDFTVSSRRCVTIYAGFSDNFLKWKLVGNHYSVYPSPLSDGVILWYFTSVFHRMMASRRG